VITLNRNLEIITDISPKIGSPAMVDERIDLTVLESVSEYKYHLLSLRTCVAVDEATYHLWWYFQKLEALIKWVLEHTSESGSMAKLPYGIGYLQGSLSGHRFVVEDFVVRAIKLLKEEIESLGATVRLPKKVSTPDEEK
jgi:hypothetical protein